MNETGSQLSQYSNYVSRLMCERGGAGQWWEVIIHIILDLIYRGSYQLFRVYF